MSELAAAGAVPTRGRPDTVSGWVGRFNRRDIDGMLGLMSTEVEIHPLRLHGLDPSYRGHDGVRGWFDEIARQQHRHLIDVAELVEISDDRVLSAGRIVVRNQTVMPFSGLYSFDAEAIVELHHYFTSSFMLGRLGVLGAGEGRPAGRDEAGLFHTAQ